MAMMAQLYTLSGLATELGGDRRKWGAALKGIQPDGKAAGRDAWFIKTAIAADRGDGTALDGPAEKARLDKARADLAELDLARKRGDVVDIAIVSAVVSNEYATVRAGLMQLPTKIAALIAPDMTKPVIQDLVLREVTDVLSALSADGDAKLYSTVQSTGAGEGEESEAAAEADSLAMGG